MSSHLGIKVLASGSSGNAYTVTDGQTTLLLDCGISIKQLQAKLSYKAGTLDACLITHEHGDHIRAAKDLAKLGVRLYASKATFDAIGIKGHRIIGIQPLKTFIIGTFQVMAFQVMHDAADPVGYYIQSTRTGERLLYVTDTYYIPYRFRGLHYLLIECNYVNHILKEKTLSGRIDKTYGKRIYQSHMSLKTVVDFIESLEDPTGIKEVYLLHLSDNNSDEHYMKEIIQKVTGAIVYVA